MPDRPIRTSRAAITTATAVVVAALLAATIALAATAGFEPATGTASALPAAEHSAPSEKTLAFLNGLVPPPGAAILLVAGILAVVRRR